MNSQKKRIATLDIARGLGIIAVSIYHLVYRPKDGVADQIISECIWLILPFFFLMSGYNFKKNCSFRDNITHRIKAMLIPALKYTAVLLVLGGIYCAFFHSYTVKDWLRDYILILGRNLLLLLFLNGVTVELFLRIFQPFGSSGQ